VVPGQPGDFVGASLKLRLKTGKIEHGSSSSQLGPKGRVV
jgi:hypothetical protein